MEVKLGLWPRICSAIAMSSMLSSIVSSSPIRFDFDICQTAEFPIVGDNGTGPLTSIQCCPLKPTKPAINGPPPPSTSYTRVRKAAQCADAEYAAKLNKAYALLRALPDSDPRSLGQQYSLHCAYCGGSFLPKNGNGSRDGYDIHFSWLFFPWHRWYLFFHERILQKLLQDPTFSLSYWNWDNPYTVGDGSESEDGACLKQGHNFPALYNDPSAPPYDVNRSQSAKGRSRYHFPSLYYVPGVPEDLQPNATAPEEAIIESNLNILYQALVSGGTTTETFMGRIYRAGDIKGTGAPGGGSGSLEGSSHASVHFWTGGASGLDMGQLAYSARDPIFFSHHSNVDRLWQVWKDIGPMLGQKREDFSDPDFLDAEFLFYDENKDLRRVKAGDALDSTKLGYVYQGANDAAWIHRHAPRCSKLSFDEIFAQAQGLRRPHKKKGYYHLRAGKPFVLVTDRPVNPNGVEEFLSIDEIKLNRSVIAGFDVYVGLLNPTDYTNPYKCAEYSGRFTNMAQGRWSTNPLVWKQSITRTFVDIQAPSAPSKVVISIIPFSQAGGYETIKFKSITIGCN